MNIANNMKQHSLLQGLGMSIQVEYVQVVLDEYIHVIVFRLMLYAYHDADINACNSSFLLLHASGWLH